MALLPDCLIARIPAYPTALPPDCLTALIPAYPTAPCRPMALVPTYGHFLNSARLTPRTGKAGFGEPIQKQVRLSLFFFAGLGGGAFLQGH